MNSHGDAVRALLGRVALIELAALHLASADFLRQHGQQVQLASYDARMLEAARGMALPLAPY